MPRVAPRWCGPRLSRRRALRTRLTVLGGSACGHRLGAEVRSSRPAGPCSRYRRTHLWAVALDTPAASAAETTDHPISCTRCTISRRPNGVSFALRWGTESLLSREGPCQPFTVTGGSPVSTTFVGTTASRRSERRKRVAAHLQERIAIESAGRRSTAEEGKQPPGPLHRPHGSATACWHAFGGEAGDPPAFGACPSPSCIEGRESAWRTRLRRDGK